MKLRLGLLTNDLAERFHVSEGTISSIFATWVRFLGKTSFDALVFSLPKEKVLSNLPSMLHSCHKKTRSITDCTEVLIERPKSLDVQAVTWCEYKKHNTFKFLVPRAGYTMFVSACYSGRATSKFICEDSGFYTNLEYGDEIMADRGLPNTRRSSTPLLYSKCSSRCQSQVTNGTI